MSSFIKAISYWLPPDTLTNEEISQEHPEWSVEKISAKTGIYERHIASKDITTGDMAVYACEKLFEEHNISKKNIDFILLCTQSPDYFLPTTACIVQERLKLKQSTGALDFNLGCSGYVYGLMLSQGLISSGVAENVLLVTSEAYSRFIHPEDKSNKTIFGDAASATLISSNEGGYKIGSFDFGTDGSGAENLIVRNGALKSPLLDGDDEINEDNGSFVRNSNNLYMNGAEIFKFTAFNVPELVKRTLEANKSKMEDIDMFVFHQANKYMLDFIRKKIKIPEENFFYHLEKCGNTVSSTIPIALYEASQQGRIQDNIKILIAGFGVGYSWAGCVLKVT